MWWGERDEVGGVMERGWGGGRGGGGRGFFFNDTATTEIYTLSLHDALPIYGPVVVSTPGVSPYSGWPGVALPHWRNWRMSSSDRS